eukprot:COSAG02_NODE_4458_length_5338_cov_17.424699_2_plen_64_part_00
MHRVLAKVLAMVDKQARELAMTRKQLNMLNQAQGSGDDTLNQALGSNDSSWFFKEKEKEGKDR